MSSSILGEVALRSFITASRQMPPQSQNEIYPTALKPGILRVRYCTPIDFQALNTVQIEIHFSLPLL